jgi:SAM-dependent methyltransferase
MHTSELFDTYAKDYESRFIKNPLTEYQRSMVHAILRPYLSPNKNVLDVGCGPGADFDFYKSLSLNIDAIDISREMIKAARKQAKRLGLNVRIARSAIADFVPDIKYDVVILNFGVINAIDDIDNTMQTINKILTDQGRVFIVCKPPLHIFAFKADLLFFRFTNAYNRAIKHKTITNEGFVFYHYSYKHFKKYFVREKHYNLCSILPTPTQFKHSSFARKWTKFFINMDKKLAPIIPEFIGGDHILHILKK